MKQKVSFINLVGVLIGSIITLTVSVGLQAQTHKPRQLKKEILQQQKTPVQQNTQKTTTKPASQKPLQNQPPPVGVTVFRPANPIADPTAKLVYIENSDALFFNQILHPNVQILKGNVRFRHDNALLYCDSAYFNDAANSFDAYGNVRIVQGDTLFVYGSYLNYNGNTKFAVLHDNVRMVNRNTVLTTDILNYDRAANLAYYSTGGKVEDGNNTLISQWGQYSPATKQALFKTDVLLRNPNFIMEADTLKYNTGSSIADIVGETHILYQEDTDIYSKRGWYNTSNDRMMLLNRSVVQQKNGRTMVGDTIFYDKKNKYGEAYSNVEINDTVQKNTLYGNFASYDEVKEIGLATDSALLVDWSNRKDSLFLSADTLYTSKDSIYSAMKAFKNVRFFRSDMQGMCDSLLYSARDSIMHLNVLPVVWAENNQLSGGTITAFTKNQKVNKVQIEKSAIAIQRDSLEYFNQLAGKEIIAYMDSGQVRKVNVNGNAETIYFPKDEKTKEYVGVNKTISSYVTMYLKNKKVQRIVLTSASSGTMYPLDKMGENDLYLRNFYWYEKERPAKMEDVFQKFARTAPALRPESEKKPSFPTGNQDGNSNTPNRQTPNRQNNPANNPNRTNSNPMNSNPMNSISPLGGGRRLSL